MAFYCVRYSAVGLLSFTEVLRSNKRVTFFWLDGMVCVIVFVFFVRVEIIITICRNCSM